MNFFKKIGAWFTKTFGGTNSAVIVNDMHTAASAIQVLAPGLVLVLQSAGATEVSADVVEVSNEVITDLGTLSQLLSQAQADPTNKTLKTQIVAMLEALEGNLAGLLKAGHIKNTTTLTTVTNVVNAFIAEAEVIVGMLQ